MVTLLSTLCCRTNRKLIPTTTFHRPHYRLLTLTTTTTTIIVTVLMVVLSASSHVATAAFRSLISSATRSCGMMKMKRTTRTLMLWRPVFSTESGAGAYSKTTARFFGSKRDIPTNPPGEIYIEDDQESMPEIDINRIRDSITRIRSAIGYNTYDISLLLVDDDEMKQTNMETRGINKPTDILSFPFHPAIEPGLLVEPEFDIPDYYNLGDMMIDIPYVIRSCQEDCDDNNNNNNDEDNDRGVSGAMSKVYDVEDRINMLLVHGMLHLVGHDHEDDLEYELMTLEEERILNELKL